MRGSLWPPFGGPLLALPPGWATVHSGPLALVHICAHGAGEGEAQAWGGLLLVGTAEVHGKYVLEQSRGERSTAFMLRKQRHFVFGCTSVI